MERGILARPKRVEQVSQAEESSAAFETTTQERRNHAERLQENRRSPKKTSLLSNRGNYMVESDFVTSAMTAELKRGNQESCRKRE